LSRSAHRFYVTFVLGDQLLAKKFPGKSAIACLHNQTNFAYFSRANSSYQQ